MERKLCLNAKIISGSRLVEVSVRFCHGWLAN
uniref:Uncharacterized protein n=1 Tax=Rhizophora mucronata TaxID=61149 RepID=A0A2P2NMQ5_RHIMU